MKREDALPRQIIIIQRATMLRINYDHFNLFGNVSILLKSPFKFFVCSVKSTLTSDDIGFIVFS